MAESKKGYRLRSMPFPPRFLSYKDAVLYCGFGKDRFDVEVRPMLTEIPRGKRAILFDRLDLDAFLDDYKEQNRR